VADSGHLIAEMQQQLTAFEIVQEISVTSIKLNVPLLFCYDGSCMLST